MSFTTQPTPSITIRRGHVDDSLAAFRVHHHAIEDLLQRMGFARDEAPTDEEFQKEWHSVRSLYEYLAHSADEFWVAERNGQVVGYARSCSHEGVRALTEFFVDPSAESQGVGKALVTRAFPRLETGDAATVRFVIATPESAAQSLYMRSGVYARNLIYRIARAPQTTAFSSDLEFEAAPNSPATLAHLAAIDNVILGFQRDNDHQWLLTDRQVWLYRRQGPEINTEINTEISEVVGYGYVGEQNGPFALLNAADYPAVLAHAENQAAAAGREEFALSVHSTNRHAIDYLLAERFKVGRFVTTFLTNVPFGQIDHYINTNPLFLL